VTRPATGIRGGGQGDYVMHRRQRGMTLLGILFLFAVFGVFVLAAVKLTPGYLEYLNVAKALDSLKGGADGASPTAISRSLEKAFDINDVKSIDYKQVEISRQDDVMVVRAAYDYTTPFLFNVSFQIHFDKTVEITGQ